MIMPWSASILDGLHTTPAKRCTSFVVAANDSSTLSKQQADYVCDGTADDVEIQAAIDALPSNGGKVTCLEGTFNTKNAVTGAANLILEGMGYATKIIASPTHTGVLIDIDNISNALISNLYLDGSIYANHTVLIQNASTDIAVQNCFGYGGMDDTFTATDENTKRIKFLNNTINKTTSTAGGSACIELSDDVHDVLIAGNIITGSNATYSIIGIKANYHAAPTGPSKRITIKNNLLYDLDGTGITMSAEDTIIEGNSIYNCGQDANQYGIHITDKNHIISNNSIYNPSSHGIYIGAIDSSVSNCTIDSAGAHGIHVAAGKDAISIIGNTSIKSHIAGINVGTSTDIKIQNNTCKNNGQGGGWNGNGIHISGTAARITVLGNVCYDNQGTKTQYYGIGISDTPSDLIISQNMLKGNKTGAYRNWGTVLGVNKLYDKYTDLLMDVLAVSTTHVRSNEDLSAATPITFTLDAQPDIPRTLSWSFDTHAQITEYDIEIIGIDAKGNSVTETWDETAGWSGETSNAFATITSIKMTSRTGTGVADTMDLGITDVLGLSNIIYETSDVFKIKKNNANAIVATAQVNTTYNTYDMSVIGLGAGDDFTIWYKSNLNITL